MDRAPVFPATLVTSYEKKALAIQEMRRRKRDEEEYDDTDVAATKLQGRMRMRAARKQVEAKRASMTPEGQKEHAMATRLQNLQKSKTARMAAKELQARKMAIKRQMVSGRFGISGVGHRCYGELSVEPPG